MAIKLADTLAPMADFPAAMAEHIEFSDGENLQEKLDNGSLGGGAVKNYLRLKGTVGYDPQMVEITPSLVQSVLTNATPETIEGRWILEEAETNTEIFDTDGNFSLPILEKVTFTTIDDFGVLEITDITSTAISCRAITDIDVPFEFILEWKEENDAGHIELTQAEYDALPEEEKLNGAIYFITDAEGGAGDVDNKMDTSSTNSVQNKVLVQEIARAETGKQYLKITGPMPGGISYLYAGTITDAIQNGSALNYQGVDIETVETNIKDNFYDILYRYANAGDRTYTAADGLYLNVVPEDRCIIFEAEDVPIEIDKYEVVLEWSEPPFVTIYSSEKEFDPISGYDESDYNFFDLTDLEDSLTSIFKDMKIKSEFNFENRSFSFDLNKDGNRETLKANSYKLQKDFAGNGILTIKLEDGRILTSTRRNGYSPSWSDWDIKESEKIPKVYTSLAELGLDTTATINDIVGAMADGSQFTYKTDVFDYATEYSNVQYGTVTIIKQSTGRTQVLMTDKNTGNLYAGRMDSTNQFVGWRNEAFHRVVAQATAGYFKFKPTRDGFDQPLRISVTDNYGGMINISGATPSSAQYKPFKCIRLSNGEYTNYDAIKVANNKMLKLFYLDGYFYLKVTTYTTCTFTGLIEAPTYVETFDETNAEEIPIRSVFDTPYNDGYADPSIIVIGDADSSDGIIKTLATLGFTSDIMTWDNGEYRVSHVGGLTNLPAEITEEKPGFRLEHHDVKKWGSNHNPHTSTYGCRQSILHYKGNIFVRYQESSATAGVITTDTGWQKVGRENTKELVSNAQNFKLDITKRNASFYGFIKLEYLYGYHLCEVCIGISSAIAYTVTKGKNLIDKITYTVDGANIVFGIDFTAKVYGVQVVEMPSDFGTINSLTAESFTGSTVANQTGLDLELHKQVKVVTSLDKGTWQVGQRIKQKTDFTANTNDVNFEFVAKNESSSSTGKYQKMTIYQLTPIENGTNASTSYSVFEDGKAQVSVWPHTENMPRNDYNIACEGYVNNGGAFNGKTVKTVTIDLSASDLNATYSGLNKMKLDNYISGSANVIRAEGYYNPPSDANGYVKSTVQAYTDQKVGNIFYENGSWQIGVAGSTGGKKGSGYAKLYYVD